MKQVLGRGPFMVRLTSWNFAFYAAKYTGKEVVTSKVRE